MNDHQLALESRLLQLRDEIKALANSALTTEKMKARLQELFAERSRLEDELINLVVNPENNYRSEALAGLREGLLSAVQSLEETLRGAALPDNLPRPGPKAETKKPGWFGRTFAWMAERPVVAWIATAGFVYLLLLAVSALGSGFNGLFGGQEAAKELFAFATNPFMGLLMGLLATAVIQSSSTTTSVIVALCAAGLPVTTAIPMIMGANIGTSVTNTLVSLGHIGHRREFRRAFAAATVHDFFNITAVLIFLPLEMACGLLEKVSGWLAGALYGGSAGVDLGAFNFIGTITKPVESAMHGAFRLIPGPTWCSEGAYVAFGLVLIFAAILLLGKLLRMLLTGRAEKMFHAAVGRSPVAAIGSGCLITVLVQSSSTTTSLIVPLAGAGLMKLKQVFPFTLGANIGTCVTALLAALAITGPGAEFGLQVAFIHLLFNVFGVIVIYGVPLLRRVPLVCASSLAKLASERRSMAILYIVATFFLFPLVCLGVYRLVA